MVSLTIVGDVTCQRTADKCKRPAEKADHMSRTFKDRPYWVKVNDPRNIETIEYHHHTNFGQARKKSVAVKEADGRKKTEESFYTAASGEVFSRTVTVYETKLIGYTSTECDVHEPETGAHYSEDLTTCGRYLRYFNYSKPFSYGKKEKHHASRAKERELLTLITKTEEVDGEDEAFLQKEGFTNCWARRY